jgi:hypothetical protein
MTTAEALAKANEKLEVARTAIEDMFGAHANWGRGRHGAGFDFVRLFAALRELDFDEEVEGDE